MRNFPDLLLIPIVGFICVIRVWNLFDLNLHFFIIAAVILYGLKHIFLDHSQAAEVRFDLMDVALLMLVAVEVLSFLTSTYRPNSFGYLLHVLFLFLFYYLVKFHLTREVQKTAVFWIITVLGLVLSGVGFYTFWLQYRELQSMGFTDPTNFKTSGSNAVLFFFFLANPRLLPPGELFTVLLMWLPFPLLLFFRYRQAGWWKYLLLVPVITILLTIASTFSRGLYIATFAFFLTGSALSLLYRIFSWRQVLVFNVGLLLTISILIGVLKPFREPVWNTLALFKNSSQGRSFAGRKRLWANTAEIIRERPWTGIGAQNFPLRYVPYGGGEGAAYVGRPMNYLLQVVAEKGIIGLLAYGFVLVAFGVVSHRRLAKCRDDWFRRVTIVVFMTTYLSIIIRDLSYSSILTNEGVTALLWLMFAINSQSEGGPIQHA